MQLTSSCRLCRSLSAAGRRVLSIESFAAFQGKHSRQPASTRTQALPRTQPCTCGCAHVSTSVLTVEAPTLTCTLIQRDRMCPTPAHTETYMSVQTRAHLFRPLSRHSPAHTHTHTHPSRGERQVIWEVGAQDPSPLSCSWALGPWTQRRPLAPTWFLPHTQLLKNLGCSRLWGVISSGTLNSCQRLL